MESDDDVVKSEVNKCNVYVTNNSVTSKGKIIV